MCHPASPGSRSLGKRTGSDPPTPGRRHQRSGRPISWSHAAQTAGCVPAAANGPPSGQETRTTGSVHDRGIPGHALLGHLGPDHLLAGGDHVTGDGPPMATNPSAIKDSTSFAVSTGSASHPAPGRRT